jgi:hypothetical protein
MAAEALARRPGKHKMTRAGAGRFSADSPQRRRSWITRIDRKGTMPPSRPMTTRLVRPQQSSDRVAGPTVLNLGASATPAW